MKRTLVLLSLLTATFLVGCRYDMTTSLTDKGGQLYRLDRITGDLTVVDDGALKPVSMASTNSMDLDTTSADTVDLSGTGASVAFKGKWRDGKLFYRITLKPFSKLKKAYDQGGSVSIGLTDAERYEIAKVKANLGEMIAVVDSAGRKSELEIVGKVPMSRSDFEAVSGWEPTWSFPE
ncbi:MULTISPECIES: hypothetical protein [unclassified Deinococcus]|uniref:hypothetical protein n=1 Tax=unclassified Deinococcus TaxID=2623546 RepID=UPI001C304BD6|nr:MULTISPECIES: hypothetical protein [unclassified Deinococcus]MDK2014360.1 hypothetical protein [Deinococcus sp. 43]